MSYIDPSQQPPAYGGNGSAPYSNGAGPVKTAEPTKPVDKDELFKRLKGWYRGDFDGTATWRKDAKQDFSFVAGDQWDEEDRQKLRDQLRPIITMNRIDPIIDSVSGSEVANRQEVRYIPREAGDVKVNELYTSAAAWFRDQCDAEDEESDAFRDTIVCGMGWTETRLDYETEPDGEPKIERIDPLEMVWDKEASKRNLTDMRHVFHVRRGVPLDEAKGLISGDFDDADYNATWVDGDETSDTASVNDESAYDGDAKAEKDEKGVTLVRAQWWERERVYRVLLPDQGGQTIKVLTEAEYRDIAARIELAQGQLRVVPGVRRIYKQAYLGAVLLEVGNAPCKEHFSFNCITGKRDRNANTWYGLVRGMKDPQRWANKWLSQALHILNTSAKGGIIAERGAFERDADAETSWAKQDAITWVRKGTLTGQSPGIKEKPQSPIPAGFYQLMEFAVSAIRDTSGVNLEILGMRDVQQAAALDRQRKQSSMTILQPMFDSLRRYRKMQGRQLLYIIREYLTDGRLIRIVGKEEEQYVPLVRTPGADKFDVIVDESPTSPNQKEATWAMLQQLLPAIGPLIPPQTYMALLEYSPLPTSAQQKIKASMEPPKGPDGQPLPPPPDPKVVQAKAEMEMEQEKQNAELARAQEKQNAELNAAFAKAEKEMEIERYKALEQAKLARAKAAVDAELAAQKSNERVAPSGVMEFRHDAGSIAGPLADVVSKLGEHLASSQDAQMKALMSAIESNKRPKRIKANGKVYELESD